MLAYLSGFFAGISGCVLPALALMVMQKQEGRWRFVLEFFAAQFVLFSALNMTFAIVYTVVEWVRPFLLLLASTTTLYFAYTLYVGKYVSLPQSGALLALALSPCSVGFAVATAATSFDPLNAIVNAFLFALGVVTPLIVVAFILRDVDVLMRGAWMDRISTLILVLISYYLAYLAGSSWRWIP